MVNEYPGDPEPAAWGRLMREGKRGGVQWHLWLGDLSLADVRVRFRILVGGGV